MLPIGSALIVGEFCASQRYNKKQSLGGGETWPEQQDRGSCHHFKPHNNLVKSRNVIISILPMERHKMTYPEANKPRSCVDIKRRSLQRDWLGICLGARLPFASGHCPTFDSRGTPLVFDTISQLLQR